MPRVDSGDTVWILVSTALVMLMTPGLAFFYGGLVRRKNVLSVLMQCMAILCIISIQWVMVGYSLSFGPDHGGFIGGLDWYGLRGVDGAPAADYAATVPHQAFMLFQMMFAVITPALIIGAYAERMNFGAFCVFSLLWATLVYDPVAHWTWANGGFLRRLGALDFAGGAVVHINAGMAALAAAMFLGKRIGYPRISPPPHNLPFAVLGAALLWFGWFGFNAGSALSAGALAAGAMVATHVAGAAAGLVWASCDKLYHGRTTVLGTITGAVAGLVAVTPAAGYVAPMAALAIGGLAGAVCWIAVTLVKNKAGYDDSLDAFGVHGVGGIWGALATGIWASRDVNPAGAEGLLRGNADQLLIQAATVAVIAAYSFIATYVLLKAVDALIPLRASEENERIGLDLTQHREAAYTVLE